MDSKLAANRQREHAHEAGQGRVPDHSFLRLSIADRIKKANGTSEQPSASLPGSDAQCASAFTT